MADPKYQSLPYIAVGQADIYETGDLPESDQVHFDTDVNEDTIETLVVDPKDAFRRFNKANIDSAGSNFSEEAVTGRRGYSVHYEILPSAEREEETILQKLQRLKSELKEIQDAVRLGIGKDEASPAAILSDVETLQQQIEAFGTEPIASGEKNDLAYGQLLNQLKTEPSAKKKSSSKSTKAETGGDQTLYELHMNSTSQNAKEANLEARISQMERIVGFPDEQNVLRESGNARSVMDSLAVLSSKLHLLDEENVDKVSARLQILVQTLAKVKESESTAEADKIVKVNELYELVKKWDSCADALPTIVDRLYTLQDLHQQAMEFSSSLKALETAQSELSGNVDSHGKMLKDVHKTFSANVDVIKGNVETLEKRMNALK